MMENYRTMDSHQLEQVELLMQPAFIRLIDNIRKQLEQSQWKGTYQTIENWPEGTTPEIQAKVNQLQEQLDRATPAQSVELTQALAELPQPEISYQLSLKKQEHQFEVNIWDLCYQICFCDFPAIAEDNTQVDNSLIDLDGEVDWNHLDFKARQVVEQLFHNLPQPKPEG